MADPKTFTTVITFDESEIINLSISSDDVVLKSVLLSGRNIQLEEFGDAFVVSMTKDNVTYDISAHTFDRRRDFPCIHFKENDNVDIFSYHKGRVTLFLESRCDHAPIQLIRKMSIDQKDERRAGLGVPESADGTSILFICGIIAIFVMAIFFLMMQKKLQ